MSENTVKTCVSCKITSIACLLAMGTYLLHLSKPQRGKSKIIYATLAAASISLGIGEIFDKSPFRQTQQ